MLSTSYVLQASSCGKDSAWDISSAAAPVLKLIGTDDIGPRPFGVGDCPAQVVLYTTNPGQPTRVTMIARIWRGAVARQDGDAYADYMQETGVAGYVKTPGNRGVWMLRRETGDRTEFVMFTLWDSLDAVKAFAGPDYEVAVFYPEDDRFLVDRDLTSTHYEVHTHAAPE